MHTGYHFTGPKLRDGRPIPKVRELLTVEGEIKICRWGLHGSDHAFDALLHAPGLKLHLVKYWGDVDRMDDKWAARSRVILKSFHAEDMLRKFTASLALRLRHLWDMPEEVERYLETLDPAARDAAVAKANSAWRDIFFSDWPQRYAAEVTLSACARWLLRAALDFRFAAEANGEPDLLNTARDEFQRIVDAEFEKL